MAELTQEELERLDALERKATPGPWTFNDKSDQWADSFSPSYWISADNLYITDAPLFKGMSPTADLREEQIGGKDELSCMDRNSVLGGGSNG